MQGEATRVIPYQSNLKPDMMRALHQTAETAGYTQVSLVKTARDLQQAVSAGKRHIEIRQHLDLTTINPSDYDDYSDSFFVLNLSSSTLSIRVRLPSPLVDMSMHTPAFPENCRACSVLLSIDAASSHTPRWHLHAHLRVLNLESTVAKTCFLFFWLWLFKLQWQDLVQSRAIRHCLTRIILAAPLCIALGAPFILG
jgi:hypothetical protein